MMQVLKAARVFDGTHMHAHAAVSLSADGRIAGLHFMGDPLPAPPHDLGAGILAPGLVDVQVNGGGGVMVGADTDAAQLAHICATHARLGACAILPTLITDTPETTQRVIAAGIAAARDNVAGFAGLHLEGPHLDPARKGAHDAALMRPMRDDDLALICDAARKLPALMVTLAPEAVTLPQITALARAGVVVSLGHSGCSSAAARAAHAAGAVCVTHLYNAMGPLQNRAPGLVGAALTSPLAAGIIADGVHVAPECLQVALQMKAQDDLFIVSDSMAVAGTTLCEFTLGGRRILRAGGRLTLDDGTLAGADISLPQSLACLARLGVAPERALSMASRVPADLIGATDRGRISAGARGDLVFLSDELDLRAVWRDGQKLPDCAGSAPPANPAP
ncbi:N-acetylglucosamine-6-phosphate deacetylase [Roseinatronobacter sp. NSM]|uniref:N-acetylglucosamine-6-phosphate deacetylase n=1 Tax=Roseinatronobacter sp. NSM TaxID=3457785 RepID=UPI004035D569